MRKTLALSFLAIVALTCSAGLRVRWKANPVEDNVVDYRVFCATGDTLVWVKSAGTATQLDLTGTVPEGLLRLHVTAVDAIGLESLPSKSVYYTNKRPSRPNLKQPQG